VFAPNEHLTSLQGTISIVYTGSFFHLFDYAPQVEIAKLIVRLLKPEKGSMLLGRQVGNITSGVYSRPGYRGEISRFRHNEHSWKEMWEKVGEETGTRWDVQVQLDEFRFGAETSSSSDAEKKLAVERREPGTRRLRFVVTRL
jgi:hypothetical protein